MFQQLSRARRPVRLIAVACALTATDSADCVA